MRRPVVPVLAVLLAAPMGFAALAPRHAATAAAVAGNGRDLAKAAPESMGVSSERLRRLDAGMKRVVDDGRLAGVSTLVARRGRTIHFSASGRKDIRRADPIGRDTIFRIYSMTKPITGLAMMMLYEEGRWRLDDPVSRYVPEFSTLQVYAGDNADGTMKVETPRRPMTMRELMTHSAGLGYVLNQTHPVDRRIQQDAVLNEGAPLQTMIDKLSKVPLLAQPGARWYYSIAVDVQGYLVEKLSGQPFAEFLRARIFDPIGMRDTAFFVPQEKLARLALVHAEGPDGRTQPPAAAGDVTVAPAGPSGGGGLFSTADDYLRFAQMLLNGGELDGVRLVAPRTVEMMRTNHLQREALATMRPGTGWGLGFRVYMNAAEAGEPVADGTYDWFGAAGTWFWIDPKTDLVVVGMMQNRGRINTEVHGLSRNLMYQAITN